MKVSAIPLALALLAAAPAVEARGSRRRCRETAVPVVGRAKCRSFGRWDVSYPILALAGSAGFELGWHRLLIAPRALGADLTVNHKTTSFALSGDKIGLPRADIGTGRLSFEIGRVGPVRIGPAIELGGSTSAGRTFMLQGQPRTITGALYGSLGLDFAAGLSAGPLFLRAEIFGGVQALGLSAVNGYVLQPPARRPGVGPLFWPPPGGGGAHGPPPDGLALGDTRFRLAPRASVEVWTTDFVTLGVAGAADVIYRDDFMLGAFLRSYYDRRGLADPRTQ